jgi:hypothetical protein
MIQHITVYATEAEPKRPFGAMIEIVRGGVGVSTPMPPGSLSCLVHRKWGPVPHINNGKQTCVIDNENGERLLQR